MSKMMSDFISKNKWRVPVLCQVAVLTAISTVPVSAATTLFSDNFNVANNTLDAAAQGPNRYTGLLAGTTESHAALAQSNIINQQISSTGGGTAIRFVESANLSNRINFASGASGSAIVSGGGFLLELDRVQSVTSNDNWVGIGVGGVVPGGDAWIADGALDFGFLLRNNGNAQRFDNGISADIASAVTPTLTTQHYRFQFLLDPLAPNPFADGASVTVSASINGAPISVGPGGQTSYTFQWAGNGGNIQIEYFWEAPGGTLDNLSISAIPEPSITALGALAGITALGRRRRSR